MTSTFVESSEDLHEFPLVPLQEASAPRYADILINVLQRPYRDLTQRFSLGEELGNGTSGVVRRCVDTRSGREYACKSIDKREFQEGDEDVDAVRMEVVAMQMLRSHPGIVTLKDTYEDAQFVHLIMELCEGGELFDVIKQKTRYSETEAARICSSIVSVLAYCHQKGIMHRDLKPENILLTTKDDCTNIRIADFGQAAFTDTGRKLTQMVGSKFYIAPEVLQHSYGPQADLWSLGVILYILLAGTPPFWARNREEIFAKIERGMYDLENGPWKWISHEAKDLISRLLTCDPRERITAAQVSDHPWIMEHCRPGSPIPVAMPADFVETNYPSAWRSPSLSRSTSVINSQSGHTSPLPASCTASDPIQITASPGAPKLPPSDTLFKPKPRYSPLFVPTRSPRLSTRGPNSPFHISPKTLSPASVLEGLDSPGSAPPTPQAPAGSYWMHSGNQPRYETKSECQVPPSPKKKSILERGQVVKELLKDDLCALGEGELASPILPSRGFGCGLPRTWRVITNSRIIESRRRVRSNGEVFLPTAGDQPTTQPASPKHLLVPGTPLTTAAKGQLAAGNGSSSGIPSPGGTALGTLSTLALPVGALSPHQKPPGHRYSRSDSWIHPPQDLAPNTPPSSGPLEPLPSSSHRLCGHPQGPSISPPAGGKDGKHRRQVTPDSVLACGGPPSCDSVSSPGPTQVIHVSAPALTATGSGRHLLEIPLPDIQPNATIEIHLYLPPEYVGKAEVHALQLAVQGASRPAEPTQLQATQAPAGEPCVVEAGIAALKAQRQRRPGRSYSSVEELLYKSGTC